MSEFHDIAKEAREYVSNNAKTDTDKVLLNLLTLGAFSIDTEDTRHLESIPMPDAWCESVSELPNISKKGLGILTNDLTKNGFVSVAAARFFLDNEKSVRAKKQEKLRASKKLKQVGSAKLLARAEKENPGSIDSFISLSKDIGAAVSGSADDTLEKVAWIGKGLVKAASAFKDE